jgi:hypothetical protein
MRQMPHLDRWLGLFGLCACVGAAGCGGKTQSVAPPASESPRWRFDVYATHVGVVYQYEQLVPKVDAVVATEVPVASVTELDVARCTIAPRYARTMTLTLTDEASARVRSALSARSETEPVVATLDRARLWVGVVYDPRGAAAIETPIASFGGLAAGPITIEIDEAIGVGLGGPTTSATPTRIDVDAVRALFTARGVLVEGQSP